MRISATGGATSMARCTIDRCHWPFRISSSLPIAQVSPDGSENQNALGLVVAFACQPLAPVFIHLPQQLFEFRPLVRGQHLPDAFAALVPDIFIFRVELR